MVFFASRVEIFCKIEDIFDLLTLERLDYFMEYIQNRWEILHVHGYLPNKQI